MITPIPSIDVCRSRETGEIVILQKAALYENRLYLGNVTVGRMDRFTDCQFAMSGLAFVRESLNTFHQRPTGEKSEFDRLEAKGKRAFLPAIKWLASACVRTVSFGWILFITRFVV